MAADFTPEISPKHAMASYYQVVFIPPQCTGLKIAALWEVIQQWESQPCPRATVSLGWVSRMAGFGNSFSCLICVLCYLPGKEPWPRAMEGLSSYPLWPSRTTALPLDLPEISKQGSTSSRGSRFPKASVDLAAQIYTADYQTPMSKKTH